ncbi:MAG: biosynthetic arginine decarboxylase [Acidobacteria bacterium]|nr:biosynthetic arginine decarboxylase [Acidobacteriota bacterium]MBI3426538.1 biosynthetic arginine decarboxylase [Acidobacteriota bacterium]
MKSAIAEAVQTYGIENWGAGYFDVNPKGNLVVYPVESDPRSVDVKKVVDDLLARRIKLPVLLRFPQIFASQVRKMNQSFRGAMREFDYKGEHLAVFPLKVNQRRQVIESYLEEATKYNYGLEAGSKSELYAAIALEQSPNSLLVCNGFKDDDFIDLAFVGTKLGKNVVIVIEKLSELGKVIDRVLETGVKPMVGMRVRLYSRGSGRWEKSGGEQSKFGLTTTELLQAIKMLRDAGMQDMLRVLHFHIGSQITQIKRVKAGVKEAARVYAKIRKMGYDVDHLNVGGGAGVDYDGSKTSFESSVNYTLQEFANDVIYTIKGVCEEENVPQPNVITESGRVLVAYHAMLITNILDEIETVHGIHTITITGNEAQVIKELYDLYTSMTAKNFLEYYHDALEHKEELFTLFDLGFISLEDRAKGEVLFWEVCDRANNYAKQVQVKSEEFDDLRKLLSAKYLCNFSVFRSVPDHWAIDQLFPIIPIHKLNEQPTDTATLCDITCDSDGVVDKFVDLHDVKEVLEVHDLKRGEPYYLAMMLVGAYQEVMGNFHNLFGTTNEAHVIVDKNGEYHINRVIAGSQVGDMLTFARYEKEFLQENFRNQLNRQVKKGQLTETAALTLTDEYERHYTGYTYLDSNGR